MFFDALPTQRAPAIAAIGLIGLLFEAHRTSKNDDGEVDVDRRRKLAEPILAALDLFEKEERVRHADYVHDVLLLLPTWPEAELAALMPVNWGRTRTRDDVCAMLAERSILGRSRPVASA